MTLLWGLVLLATTVFIQPSRVTSASTTEISFACPASLDSTFSPAAHPPSPSSTNISVAGPVPTIIIIKNGTSRIHSEATLSNLTTITATTIIATFVTETTATSHAYTSKVVIIVKPARTSCISSLCSSSGGDGDSGGQTT